MQFRKYLFFQTFCFFDYLNLQKFLYHLRPGLLVRILSLKISAISLRNNNERPEAIDPGTLITSGLKVNTIIESVN